MSSELGAADLAKGIAGQRILITAGAGGIGLAIARRLARHGARIFVCDVDDKALDAFGSGYPQAGRTKADVSDDASVDRLFDAIADTPDQFAARIKVEVPKWAKVIDNAKIEKVK